VSALDGESALVTRFIRKLRGGSQPIMVEASDGFTYVLKFSNNPQGRSVSFNEAMGTELYRVVGLPVPKWKPLNVTGEFLCQNPQCWLETPAGPLMPDAEICFGSRYLGGRDVRIWEIMPHSSFSRIVNISDFYLAWLLDICASHTDNRQAIFEDHLDGIRAVFVDHDHMFSGPDGRSGQPEYRASAYADVRIYERGSRDCLVSNSKTVLNISVDKLWRKSQQLPIEWLTDAALRNFRECLNMLADAKAVQSIVELIAGFPEKKGQREFLTEQRTGVDPDWLLRAGIPGA